MKPDVRAACDKFIREHGEVLLPLSKRESTLMEIAFAQGAIYGADLMHAAAEAAATIEIARAK